MQKTIIGFFKEASDAERASEQLRSRGFSDSDIDITRYATEQSTSEYDSPMSRSDESRYGTESSTPSGTITGQDRIRDRDDNEGFGDSIGRFFRNLFDNKEEAEHYATMGRRSSIVSVYTDSSDEAERAREILDDCGAVDIDEVSAQDSSGAYASGSYTENRGDITDSSERTADFETRNSLDADGVTDRSLPVIEESINVGKREVERGGVRVRSRIFERPVEENLRLREERVRVDRVPADRPATDADFETFREGEIELTESAEVPIVNKEARVVEEVRLSKEVNEREETVRDTVRGTDVDIEKIEDESGKSRRRRR